MHSESSADEGLHSPLAVGSLRLDSKNGRGVMKSLSLLRDEGSAIVNFSDGQMVAEEEM